MAIPAPEPGLVISYAYLWHREHQAGAEEGRKSRPSVVVLVVTHRSAATQVIVLPITHSAPADPASAVEIPRAVARHLGLDEQRGWVVVSEGNVFEWPGFDLRRLEGGRFDYGYLPPRFFRNVLERMKAWNTTHKTRMSRRT